MKFICDKAKECIMVNMVDCKHAVPHEKNGECDNNNTCEYKGQKLIGICIKIKKKE